MTGAQLRKARKLRNLSVAKAAEQAGVSHRTWCRWEAADAVPLAAARLVALLWGFVTLTPAEEKGAQIAATTTLNTSPPAFRRLFDKRPKRRPTRAKR